MKQQKEQLDSEQLLNSMATKEFNDDITALLKSRTPLLFLYCNEEKRLKSYFKYLASSRGYKVFIWDCYLGLLDLSTEKKALGTTEDLKEATVVLDKIIEQAELDKETAKEMKDPDGNGSIFILLDFHRFLQDNDPLIERRIKRFSSIVSTTHIVMTGSELQLSKTIEDYVSVLDFPYPNKKEIEKCLDNLIDGIEKQGKLPNLRKDTEKNKEDIINSANGLTMTEVQTAFNKSVVTYKKFDIKTILKEKEQVIKKRGVLEFLSNDISTDNVGGLENLTNWLKLRKSVFSSDASSYGIPAPKGTLVLGPPGTGKSLCAKAAAGTFGIPLLRLDFGRLYGSLVGESERTTRDIIRLAETVAPCVLENTNIVIDNKNTTIKEAFESAENNIKNQISIFKNKLNEEEQKIIYINKENNIKIDGFKDGEIKQLNLKALIRTKKNENIIRITTKSGKFIEATKNHMIMNEKGKMIQIKDFVVGDIIITAGINSTPGENSCDNKK